MKNVATGAIAALLASTAIASAGGIDRSGQSVGILFEEGSYVEFSYGYVDPTVSGTTLNNIGGIPTEGTGDMAPSYSLVSVGFKTDVGDKISTALIFDQPFGSVAGYPLSGSLYATSVADLSTTAITLVASYDVSDNIVIFGGGSYQTMSATATLPFYEYTVDAEAGSGFGYVIGAAYQIPEIALRVALTYRSEITTEHDTSETGPFSPSGGVTNVTTPQSLNLEFQTGINTKTLVFGSIRWVEWSKFHLSPPDYLDEFLSPVVDYEDDRITYNLGVGRKLSDSLSGALTIGYEARLDSNPSPLSPTDGFMSVGVGLTYAFSNVEITGGVKYLWIGDADGLPADAFADNNAMAFGLKVAFSL